MRILTVTHFFEAHGGGIERVAGELCRQFARLGANPVWAASDGDAAPIDIETVRLRCANPIERLTGLPMPLPGLRALVALAREVRRCDAVVVHDALYATSVAAALLAKLSGKRLILIQHIAAIAFARRALRALMSLGNALVTQPMLWAADARLFISGTVREALLGSPPRLGSTLVFNGVDSSRFYPAERLASRSEGPREILFVGRYVEKKGLAVLRALAEMRPDLHFTLVGTGPMRPAEWGLPNVKDFGARGADEVADLYRSMDLLLLPSVGEGYPLVVQEAMACALPVVCGEPANLADPDAARWLRGVPIDLADPKGSAARCAEAVDSYTLSAAARAAMARYARRRYDWDVMARSVMVLAQTGRRAAVA